MLTAVSTAFGTVPAHAPWYDGGFSPWFLLFPLFWVLVIGLLIFVAPRA